jgi:hypothetical protein
MLLLKIKAKESQPLFLKDTASPQSHSLMTISMGGPSQSPVAQSIPQAQGHSLMMSMMTATKSCP